MLKVVLLISTCMCLYMANGQKIQVPTHIGDYQLIWNDEFDKEGAPDNKKWIYDNG